MWTSLAILPAALLAEHLSEWFGHRPAFLAIGAVNVVALPVLVLVMAGFGPEGFGPLLGYGLLLTVCANASLRPRPSCGTVGSRVGGLMTTFVRLASPTMADIPGRLAIFLAVCVLLFLAGAALCRETRGALEREPLAA